jgi:hypothetical protein
MGTHLFARLDYMNTYRPVAVLRLESHGDGTELKINFVSPGVLLVLAWILAAAGVVARFSAWGSISLWALAALHVHCICSLYSMREQRDITDDVTGHIADALVLDKR